MDIVPAGGAAGAGSPAGWRAPAARGPRGAGCHHLRGHLGAVPGSRSEALDLTVLRARRAFRTAAEALDLSVERLRHLGEAFTAASDRAHTTMNRYARRSDAEMPHTVRETTSRRTAHRSRTATSPAHLGNRVRPGPGGRAWPTPWPRSNSVNRRKAVTPPLTGRSLVATGSCVAPRPVPASLRPRRARRAMRRGGRVSYGDGQPHSTGRAVGQQQLRCVLRRERKPGGDGAGAEEEGGGAGSPTGPAPVRVPAPAG
ncbi:hypothetical protein SGLAU_32795 (plasmid) [Streptomyces glaucescens]|uniref:Uncharacterized protein n=1 Tax=Streptomyces glaucescens TaxID=1907 RepID=A0A089XGS8_STRGA|nr:hypothetical protein SGLAU_32795 [Streptomyces glaucescens]